MQLAGCECYNSCKLLPCSASPGEKSLQISHPSFETILWCTEMVYLCFQIHRDFRKPLIVMSPKNLLRHKDCKSNLSEFDDLAGHPGFDKQGTRFKRLIKDQNNHKDLEEGINRLVLCSGKVGCIILGSYIFKKVTFLSGKSASYSLTFFFFCYYCRSTMNWMKKEGRRSALMLLYVELSSSARSPMTSSSAS